MLGGQLSLLVRAHALLFCTVKPARHKDVMGVQAVLLDWLPTKYLSELTRCCANAPPTLFFLPIRTHAQFACKVERASNKLTSMAGGPAWQPTA